LSRWTSGARAIDLECQATLQQNETMSTNLTIDDHLLEEARQAGRHATQEDAVRCALEEYVSRRRRQRIIDLFGTVEYEDDYDYKVARRRDRP
jgi:hypothetical protein